MDIRLKGDMDGVAAAEQIRARFDIPVVYLTAYADDNLLQRAKITQPFGYILKPFQERELHATVEMALYKHSLEARHHAFLKAIPDLMFRASQDGTFLDYMAAKEEDPALPPEVWSGKNMRDVLPPEVAQLAMHCVEQALQTGDMQIFEYQLPTPLPNGIIRDYEARFVVSGKDEVLVIARDITEHKQAEQALRESEERYRRLVELSPDAIVVVSEGKIVFANPAEATLMGASSPEELIGKSAIELLHPEDRATVEERLRRIDEEGDAPHVNQGKIVRLDGQVRDIEAAGAPIIYQGKKAVQIICRDITERKRAEEQITASLKEKEVLLREIHHRVKNNLQIISSLLNLQSRFIEDKEALEIFSESQNRVRSLALIHEKLYRSQDLARIDFGEYLRSLADNLLRSYGVDSNVITVKINADAVSLDIDTAIPCALIVNELVSNSLKHAFPAGKEGEIGIDFRVDNDNKFLLAVSDNGVGLPRDFDFQNTESFGLQLVSSLVSDQLEGTIELHSSSGGAEFKMEFDALQPA